MLDAVSVRQPVSVCSHTQALLSLCLAPCSISWVREGAKGSVRGEKKNKNMGTRPVREGGPGRWKGPLLTGGPEGLCCVQGVSALGLRHH